jgi:molybdopterin/thiamine biosynthesis adenylyltransferase
MPGDSAATKDQLANLGATGAVALRHDTIWAQLVELVEDRHPSMRLSKAELDDRVRTHLDGRDPSSYGTWVYFPWSRRLVHVLPEAELRELRTSRNRNKITREEQAKLAQLSIGVVGLSVGQQTAVTLVMEGIGCEFRLADFDELSLTNLNRLRAGVHDLGVNKAVLTARQIFEIDPYANVVLFSEGINPTNIDTFLRTPRPLDLVIEECDDLSMKVSLRERARAYRMAVLMETNDRGLLDIERFDREPERPLLHGFLDQLSAEQVAAMAPPDRLALVMRILGGTTSPRLAASLEEIGRSLKTWPQLASGVALGAALNVEAARRIALGTLTRSGRLSIDLDRIVTDDAMDPKIG